jgi:hypothetical protein
MGNRAYVAGAYAECSLARHWNLYVSFMAQSKRFFWRVIRMDFSGITKIAELT